MSQTEQEPSTNSPAPPGHPGPVASPPLAKDLAPSMDAALNTQSSDTSQTLQQPAPPPPAAPSARWPQRVWNKTRYFFLDGWTTLDTGFEKMVDRIATKLSPKREHFAEFFSPVLAGAAGYAVFLLFNAFGIVTLEKKSAAEALFEDVAKSLANPYFLLALFLTSLAAVFGAGTGKDIISKYVIAPFLDLTEHVLMLAFGVVLAWAFVDLIRDFKFATLVTLAWIGIVLVGFSFGCLLAERLCRGDYAAAFTKVHRRVMVRIVGGLFSIWFFHMLVHYPERHLETQQQPQAHGAENGVPSSAQEHSAIREPKGESIPTAASAASPVATPVHD